MHSGASVLLLLAFLPLFEFSPPSTGLAALARPAFATPHLVPRRTELCGTSGVLRILQQPRDLPVQRVALRCEASAGNAWLHLPRVNKGDPSVQRLRATISYDGKCFHGVQKNRGADGVPLRTILETLETSLWPVLGQRATFVAAGRTDAGVSAEGQVISFDAFLLECLASSPPDQQMVALATAFNAHLPPDIRVREVKDTRVIITVSEVRMCVYGLYLHLDTPTLAHAHTHTHMHSHARTHMHNPHPNHSSRGHIASV